eukprot:GHVN01063683.1.p1 GENE.GHVN01063683.1~~GHVN01063683.1.p1  ORF type:complete len:197 (+),score=29.34 GHVN01063683.1:789-1379(+)
MGANACSLCRSDFYLNPNLKLLVPPCFHRLCILCIETVFKKKGSEKCPAIGCDEVLNKRMFIVPFFEDMRLEKEVRIRRRLRAYKRSSEFFETQDEYEDYLEGLEERFKEIMDIRDLAGQETAVEAFIAEERARKERNRKKEVVEEKSDKRRVLSMVVSTRMREKAELFLEKEGLKYENTDLLCRRAFYDAFGDAF